MKTLGCTGAAGGRSLIHKWVPSFNANGNLYESLSVEQFVGQSVDSNTRTGQESYVLLNSGAYSAATRVSTAVGEIGVYACSVADSGAGGGVGGVLRQEGSAISIDGFGGGREFAWVQRILSVSAEPTPTEDYFVAGGLYSQEAASAEAQDGIYWYFDESNANWILKAARGGTRSTLVSSQTWDTAAWHWLGFWIPGSGDRVFGFVDGVNIGSIVSANVQPNDEIQSTVGHLKILGGGTTGTSDVDIDHVEWGWAE